MEFLTLALGRGQFCTPATLPLETKSLVTCGYEAWWAPGQVYALQRIGKSLALAWNQTLVIQHID